MQIVPLQPLPNQSLQVLLDGQDCTINVWQQAYGLFLTLLVGSTPIVQGVICWNKNRVVRSLYLGFSGDLAFWDTQGESDPEYTQLGARYRLVYLESGELPPGGG